MWHLRLHMGFKLQPAVRRVWCLFDPQTHTFSLYIVIITFHLLRTALPVQNWCQRGFYMRHSLTCWATDQPSISAKLRVRTGCSSTTRLSGWLTAALCVFTHQANAKKHQQPSRLVTEWIFLLFLCRNLHQDLQKVQVLYCSNSAAVQLQYI